MQRPPMKEWQAALAGGLLTAQVTLWLCGHVRVSFVATALLIVMVVFTRSQRSV